MIRLLAINVGKRSANTGGNEMPFRVGIGQDSHRFETGKGKVLVLGGIEFKGEKGLKANSDGDAVLHAICNALGQIAGMGSLSRYADGMCEKGIKDSREYVKVPLEGVRKQGYRITSVGIAIEGKKPRIETRIDEMQKSIAKIMEIGEEKVGVTATSGNELTAFGKGEGIQCFAVVSAVRENVYKKLVGL